MSADQTQLTIDAYFKALGTGDFARFLTADVTWTTIETDAVVRGPLAVQQAITGLHANLSDFQTRRLVTSDGAAYIEGSAERADGAPGRIPYCLGAGAMPRRRLPTG